MESAPHPRQPEATGFPPIPKGVRERRSMPAVSQDNRPGVRQALSPDAVGLTRRDVLLAQDRARGSKTPETTGQTPETDPETRREDPSLFAREMPAIKPSDLARREAQQQDEDAIKVETLRDKIKNMFRGK